MKNPQLLRVEIEIMTDVEIEIMTDASPRQVERAVRKMIERADDFTAHAVRVVKAR